MLSAFIIPNSFIYINLNCYIAKLQKRTIPIFFYNLKSFSLYFILGVQHLGDVIEV
jgi:hypothetical protein